MLLLGGCSNDAVREALVEQQEKSSEALNQSEQASVLAGGQNIGTENMMHMRAGPQLAKDVTIPQSDGTSLLVQSSAITNEMIGYYLYILPGYRSSINTDSGTMTISKGNGAEAVIEALPPQADAQLAADELWNLLQLLDEDARQLTEYARFDEWEDVYIYRAYRDEARVTAMIKTVDDIVLRITITEPLEIDELKMIMAMIASIDTEHLQLLTQADEAFVLSLLTEAYRMQLAVMEQFGDSPELETEPEGSSGNESSEGSTEAPDGTPGVMELALSDMINSKEDLLAMLEQVYTSDAARSVADMLGVVEFGGIMGLTATIEGTKLLWDQAKINMISETDTNKRFLLRVPFEGEGLFKLYEIELRKQTDGWRIHTPLKTHAEAPATSPA